MALEGELERLKRDYLPMWSEWCRASKCHRGLPTEVPYVDYMRPLRPDNFDADERPDPWAVKIVDEAVNELTETKGLHLARAVLSVRYMSAGLPAVFRSGRVKHLSLDEVEDLCDEAERRLVPLVKRRGLPL